MVSIESVERGLARYIDRELMPSVKTDGIKGFAIGTAAALLVKRGGGILREYAKNPLLQQMGLVSPDGSIDLDALREAAASNIPASGLIVDLPMGITMRFQAGDVDSLYKYIREEASV